MEEARCGVQAKRLDFEEDVQWMNRLVEAHPVLSKLPEWLKRSSGGRTLRKEGFAVHLYSGEEGGYTLGRSMKSLGGPHKKLVELDRKQGTDYDLLRDGGPYAGLLRAAVEG